MRKRIAAVLATCALSIGVGADVAAAQPEQNGLVNVIIGDVTILENVGVGVAANVVANVCGVQVNAAVIAEQVVRNNEPLVRTCEAVAGDPTVTITQ
jgi:hypothetical protein